MGHVSARLTLEAALRHQCANARRRRANQKPCRAENGAKAKLTFRLPPLDDHLVVVLEPAGALAVVRAGHEDVDLVLAMFAARQLDHCSSVEMEKQH